ncbi:MAG: hypothetical protein JWO82_2181 [Akkermansiaceae bacterium]|nr:hypothetical protein [Akkermansiaceae bacterium]
MDDDDEIHAAALLSSLGYPPCHFSRKTTKRMNTTTKRSTTISIDGSLLQVAKEKAREERRTLSAQLELWIEEKLAAVAAAAAGGAEERVGDEGKGGPER